MIEHDDGYYGKVIPIYGVKDCSYKSPWEPILDAKFKGVEEKLKMNKMIGKSGFNWLLAPNTATHKFIGRCDYYKKESRCGFIGKKHQWSGEFLIQLRT